MPDRLTKEHRKFALEHQLLHEIVKKTKDANEVKLLFHLLDIQNSVEFDPSTKATNRGQIGF